MTPELIKTVIGKFGLENVMTFIIDNARRITYDKGEIVTAIEKKEFTINYEDGYLEKHEIMNGLNIVIVVPFDHIQTIVFYD